MNRNTFSIWLFSALLVVLLVVVLPWVAGGAIALLLP
jgi:hypothetical protein